MGEPHTDQSMPNAARELPLPGHFTQERERPDDDSRVSRDHTPGSAMQPEPQLGQQHRGQQHASRHAPGASQDDPHQRFQPPQYPQQQQQWQHHQMMQNQMHQQMMHNQMAQQQFGEQQQFGPYDPSGFGYGPQFGGPQLTQQQQQPQRYAKFQLPQQWTQQQHQQQQQQHAQGAALSTSERPSYPPAPSRRPLDGPPGGSSKKQKQAFEFMTQPRSGLTYEQLTDEANRPEPTPEGEALSGTRMFEIDDLDMAEALVWVGRWAKGAEAVSVRFSLPGNKTNFRESDVQQSLHAAMRRKHLPESFIDSVLGRTLTTLPGPGRRRWQRLRPRNLQRTAGLPSSQRMRGRSKSTSKCSCLTTRATQVTRLRTLWPAGHQTHFN